MLKPIYTQPENCQDCYKCIRECPVKAIKIEDNKAYIIEERCVYCGHCTQVCPTGAKKIRDGLTRTKLAMQSHPNIYLSLAPSYISEFPGVPSKRLIAAIKKLGFKGVSETALGAEVVSARTEHFLDNSPKSIYISSACPVIVHYIQKYSPEYTDKITPILSPMLAHAKILKQTYGEDIKVIFAGPCIGKKLEADLYADLVDVAITFKDLAVWFKEAGIDLNEPIEEEENEKFIPYRSKLGSLYPIEGGMLEGLQKPKKPVFYMAFSDLPNIREVLKNITPDSYSDSIFLELLACKGGCINGPAKINSISQAIKRYEIIQKTDMGNPVEDFKELDIEAGYDFNKPIPKEDYTEEQIKQALFAVGKLTLDDELNCSSCGYDSCRDFAVAMIENRAEDNMCASYMRKIAHDKATMLLQKIPAGVLLVNSDLKIVDMNRYCAVSLGEDVAEIYDMHPGMDGAYLSRICSFEKLFETVLSSGREIKDRHVKYNDKMFILSIYNIQQHRLVFGLLQNLQDTNVKTEWIIEQTKEVIKNHMTTVQQVAGLLGENAAYTDATLRSIIEAYNKDNTKENF